MKLIVGLGPDISAEHAELMKDMFAAKGIDAVVISNCTALAVIPEPLEPVEAVLVERRRWWPR